MTTPTDSKQEELALSAMRAHALFPGRTTIYTHEVAHHLSITVQHVLDLIEEYRDTDGKSGMMGLNVANGLPCNDPKNKGVKVPRGCWRVPVKAFDDFVTRAAGLTPTQPTKTTTTK